MHAIAIFDSSRSDNDQASALRRMGREDDLRRSSGHRSRDVSPYLQRSLRSLEEALRDRTTGQRYG